MNQPLTPEMLEGTVEERAKAYYYEKSDHLGICATNWEDIDEVAREYFRNTVRNSPDFLRQKVESLTAHIESQARRVEEGERYHAALTKINAIRNSIVAAQNFNFSEHAYPLVAVLNEAGFKGCDYELAAKNLGTLIEQRDSLRTQLSTAKEAIRVKDEALLDSAKLMDETYDAILWEQAKKNRKALSAAEGGGVKQ